MLKWVFGADTRPFRQGLAQMRGDVAAFSGSIKGQLAGVFGVGVITAWGKAMLDQAGRIDDLSKRLDMSAESIQRIGYASEQAGGNIEVAAKGITVLTRNLAEAERGSTAFDDAAKVLGLDLQKMQDMSPEDQLVEIARGYAAAADKGQALTSVIQLMGKGGAEMAPMLAEGPDELRAKMEEAVVATNEQVAVMAALGDKIDALKSKSLAMAGALVDAYRSLGAYAKFYGEVTKSVWTLNGDGFGNARDNLRDNLDRIHNGDAEESERKRGAKAAQEEAEEYLKAATERQKLQEEIAKLEEEARLKGLSIEQQITEQKEKQAKLAADAIFGGSLEARKQELEIAKEIARLEEEKTEIARKAGEETAALSQSLADAVKAEAEVDKENRRAAMSDQEKLADMKREQADLIRQANESQKAGQYLDAIQKRTEAKAMNGGIATLQNAVNTPKVPTIAADEMRRWGGSSKYAEVFDKGKGMEVRQDKTNDLLQSIDRKLPEKSSVNSTDSPF